MSATGVVLELDQSFQLMKKLKLTGTAAKIFRNTAFIKDMFTSSLEVAKFVGAKIRTVSGIRGQIKKALKKPEGSYRATFEDRILASDIVFLRSWAPVKMSRYYNPITSHLVSTEDWPMMKTIYQLRQDSNAKIPVKKDSEYKVNIKKRLKKEIKHFYSPQEFFKISIKFRILFVNQRNSIHSEFQRICWRTCHSHRNQNFQRRGHIQR